MKSKGLKITLASEVTCTGCAACANVCKHQAIQMIMIGGFYRPRIIRNICVGCGLCVKTCPIVSKKDVCINFTPKIYAAVNKSSNVLQKSSSGGVFYSLADWIISKKGVVFGAKFDGIHLKHDFSENLEDIVCFMGSKYIQSDISNSYINVKKFLSNKRLVLFSGTPCQIAGLKKYLSKDYSNLLTVDLICHGVPSPVIWTKYINRLKKELNAVDIKNICFRTKRNDIPKNNINFFFSLLYLKNDGTWYEYGEDCYQNPYFSYFMRHLFSPSCYNCQFRSVQSSHADFTIGDCWNAFVDHPDMPLDNGISTVICHTEKAYKIMRNISNQFYYEDENVEVMAMRYEEAKIDEKREKKLRLWKFSNFLAQYIPLQYISFIYMHDRIDFILKRKIDKIWKKNTK